MTLLSSLTPGRGQIAVGTLVKSPHATAPSGYLLCDGSAVSRATYANLFAAIGTLYGVGNGSTTFNVPDMRGIFLRGTGAQTILGKTFTGASVGTKVADGTAINGLSAATVSTPSLSLSNTDLSHTHSYSDATSAFVTDAQPAFPNTAATITLNPTNASEAETTGNPNVSLNHSHTVTPSITGVTTTLSSTASVSKPGSISFHFFIKA